MNYFWSTPQTGHWKHLPLITLITVVALLIAALAIAWYYETTFRAQSTREIAVQAKVLGAAVSASLIFDDRATTQDYVDALEGNTEIHAVGVYNQQGELVARYSRGNATVPLAADAPYSAFDGDQLTIFSPIHHLDREIGMIYISAVTEPVASRIARYSVIGLLAVLAALALIILTASHAALVRAHRQLLEQIEERQKFEAALQHSQKMEALGKLSGGMAHDFNNLLTIIKTNLVLIDRRLGSGQTDVSRFIKMAEEGVARATAVIQRILAFSRASPLAARPLSLPALIDELEPLIRNAIGPSIELVQRIQCNWTIHCDQSQLESVILNLLINARDAMPEGGQVVIEVSDAVHEADGDWWPEVPAGEYVAISVRDTGTGMPEDVRRRAMDPFFTTKPVGQGTGLGLSMAYGFVTQSKGYIRIDSEPGKGASITILLPRSRYDP